MVFECAVVLILIWWPEYASPGWRDVIPARRGIADSAALCLANAEWRNVTGAPTRQFAVCENDRPQPHHTTGECCDCASAGPCALAAGFSGAQRFIANHLF